MRKKKKITRQKAIGYATYAAIAKFGGASPKLMAFRAFLEGLKYLPDEDDK
jgi:hypothetical protein